MTGRLVTLQLGPFDNHGTTRARYQGRSIEVEHGIPGETVDAEIAGQKRLRGRIAEVLAPAPDRVFPPCPYFRDWSCGGCQWQQISYPGQLTYKREEVEAAMRQAGLSLALTAVHALADPWRYRSSAGIALGKRAGFRRHASLAIVPLHDCPISHPLIGRLMAALNQQLEAGRLPDFHGQVRVEARVTGAEDEQRLHTLVRLSPESKASPEDLATLTETLAALPEVAGVALQERDGEIKLIAGDLFAPTFVSGRPVWVAAGAFFQTNLALLPELISRLRQEAEPLDGKRLADVYGGVGIFGLFLADQAREVVVIESDPLAVQAGTLTAERWDLDNVRFVTERAEQALSAAAAFDVVILDPPRSGLSPEVLEALGHRQPPLILYVSCLAQSLARDLRALAGFGYSAEQLELFDFYPQTYHVELLAVLRRSPNAP